MNRCVFYPCSDMDDLPRSRRVGSLLKSMLVAALAGSFAAHAQAQSQPLLVQQPMLTNPQSEGELPPRQFPATALRGVLVVKEPPLITIDGKLDRLAPGARIRNADNIDVLSGVLVNQRVTVNYTRDTLGQVHQVWLLSPDEVRVKRPAPARPNGPVDDGNTPYDQLPRY